MKVIECYPMGLRFLRGKGLWAVFYPFRFVLAIGYGLWLLWRRGAAGQDRRGKGSRGGARRAEGARDTGGPRIVSVGNIDVGGGGKTPCVLALARALISRGESVVVVSRGYRSIAERRAPCVVPAGRRLAGGTSVSFVTDEELLGAGSSQGAARVAAALGDEILLYRNRGVPVVIDPKRRRGVSIARELFSPAYVFLDDAYQNHSVDKDVDLLLIDAASPFGNGRLLPLGTLRERPEAVRRADAVIFTRACDDRVPAQAECFVRGKSVFFAAHEPVDLVNVRGEAVSLSLLRERACILFSGIARPASFEGTVLSLGARPRAAFRFIDHHAYGEKDVAAMLEEGGQGAAFITTEKDLAKAAELFPAGADVLALRIEMKVRDLERLLALLATASS